MFLKNKNIIFKIRRSKVTDYAALTGKGILFNKSLLLKEWLVWDNLTNVLEVKNFL